MKLGTNKHLLDKQKAARRLKKKRLALFSVVFFLIIIGLGVYILQRPELRFQKVEVLGTNIIKKEAVLSVVEEEIGGRYAYIIPRNNFLVYPQEKLQASLRDSFLRIEDLTITEKSPRELEILIKEREPVAIWCDGEFGDESTVGFCSYIDKEGLLYDEAPTFSGPVYFEIYGSVGKAPVLGGRILDPKTLEKIERLRQLLRVEGVEIVALTIEPVVSLRLHIHSGWQIFILNDSDSQLVADRLRTILNASSFLEKLVEGENQLEYIDLRYENKLFYKFRETE